MNWDKLIDYGDRLNNIYILTIFFLSRSYKFLHRKVKNINIKMFYEFDENQLLKKK